MVPGVGWRRGSWAPGFLSQLASHPWRPTRQRNPFLLPRAITLENTLVILSTVAPDAGRYYVQAVNDKNGDNKTSQPITLAVESKSAAGPGPMARRIIKSWEWGSRGSWGRWNGVDRGGWEREGEEPSRGGGVPAAVEAGAGEPGGD